MKFTFDHDLHIHTHLSVCSDDALQTPAAILEYAKKEHLATVAVTDHFWDEAVTPAEHCGFYDEQGLDHITSELPLPESEGIRFLFGCETELDRNGNVGISKDTAEKLDFMIIPTTHFHMHGIATVPSELVTAEQRAALWVRRFGEALSHDLPYEKVGIAHLVCSLICPDDRQGLLDTLGCIGDDDMKRLFDRAAKLRAGIELNLGDMRFSDAEADTVLRPFRIAKECGCRFYCGSDAHRRASFDTAREVFERAIDLLGLEETDKFTVK